MNFQEFSLRTMVFLAVFLFFFSFFRIIRQGDLTNSNFKCWWIEVWGRGGEQLGFLFSSLCSIWFPKWEAEIYRDFCIAGLDDSLSLHLFEGSRLFIGILLAILSFSFYFALTGFLLQALLNSLIFGLAGFIFPRLWLSNKARTRKQLIARSLPFAIDLLCVGLQAGQDLGGGLNYLVRESPQGPLKEEFERIIRDQRLGKSRSEALVEMAQRIQLEELSLLASTVNQSTELGSSISETLSIYAEQLRRLRFRIAERKAARVPSLIVLPTALCILPCVFIIILTPIFIQLLNTSWFFSR